MSETPLDELEKLLRQCLDWKCTVEITKREYEIQHERLLAIIRERRVTKNQPRGANGFTPVGLKLELERMETREAEQHRICQAAESKYTLAKSSWKESTARLGELYIEWKLRA